jgi:hypothetical protein
MIRSCACCKAPVEPGPEAELPARYCDRCEVAYLEFKLALLEGVYRMLAKRADEI